MPESICKLQRVSNWKQKTKNQNINSIKEIKKGVFQVYTSRLEKNGHILGKKKPFRVKQKMFPTESDTPDVME
jgi:hypothetical protein